MSLHREVFANLVRAEGWETGAELGVDKGILFKLLLSSCPKLSLIGVDLGVDPDRLARVESIALGYQSRARLYRMSTHDAADMVPDKSLDFVFIDADHSERAVLDDIDRWESKVRPGGWFGGHDYHHRKFPGVVRAVDKVYGDRAAKLAGTIWGVTL